MILHVGIAGYGDTGQKRKYWIDQHPYMRVVAVADIDLKAFPKPGPHRYLKYKTMVEDEDLDVLFVCLPNYVAAEACIFGLESGLHVFCEKPPADTLEAVDAVRYKSLEEDELKLKYGFNHRYHQSVKIAKDMIAQYGKIISMKGVYGKSRLMPRS